MGSDEPLVAGPLYGLRTWIAVGERGVERLSGPYSGAIWPDGGAWLRAGCSLDHGHAAPRAGCTCGVYGLHPSLRAARRVLAVRREIAGIVETRGTVEVHADGFRAAEGRPHVLVTHQRSNPYLLARLAAAYGAALVELRDAHALLAWCREHGVGLSEATLETLLGSAAIRRPRGVRAGWHLWRPTRGHAVTGVLHRQA
jgi:hypothetical protein